MTFVYIVNYTLSYIVSVVCFGYANVEHGCKTNTEHQSLYAFACPKHSVYQM